MSGSFFSTKGWKSFVFGCLILCYSLPQTNLRYLKLVLPLTGEIKNVKQYVLVKNSFQWIQQGWFGQQFKLVPLTKIIIIKLQCKRAPRALCHWGWSWQSFHLWLFTQTSLKRSGSPVGIYIHKQQDEWGSTTIPAGIFLSPTLPNWIKIFKVLKKLPEIHKKICSVTSIFYKKMGINQNTYLCTTFSSVCTMCLYLVLMPCDKWNNPVRVKPLNFQY